MVDRVADQTAARDVEVVDAVVAVVVADVVDRQSVVGARVELQPRVLVVVDDVAEQRVAGAPGVDDVDSVGVALPALGVERRFVERHHVVGAPAGDHEAVIGVVVAPVVRDQRGSGPSQANSTCGLSVDPVTDTTNRVVGDRDVARGRHADCVIRGRCDGEAIDHDVAPARDRKCTGAAADGHAGRCRERDGASRQAGAGVDCGPCVGAASYKDRGSGSRDLRPLDDRAVGLRGRAVACVAAVGRGAVHVQASARGKHHWQAGR